MPCVLELLSAKSRWAKATKTERRDESLHARNSICHVCACKKQHLSCLRCTALLQRSSALRLDHKQEQHLAGSVCVCGMLQLLSATSCWAKATKTERRDESLHARNSICHVCAARRCCSAVQPCLSTTSKTSTWPEVCVCGMQQADRRK